jgi:hypothetical protein
VKADRKGMPQDALILTPRTHGSPRLPRVLGLLPLVVAVGQDEAAVLRPPDEAAVGGLLVQGLGTGVDQSRSAC